MNKGELIDAVASATDDTKAGAGFGTFKTAKRAARTGRNPQTGAELKIPARTVPSFKAGAALKSAVN